MYNMSIELYNKVIDKGKPVGTAMVFGQKYTKMKLENTQK